MSTKKFITVRKHPGGQEIEEEYFGSSPPEESQPIPGFAWCFYTDAQEDTDPGGTYFGFDSADITVVTRIYVDDYDTDSDFPGETNKVSHNVAEWLRYVGEDGGYLTLFDTSDPTLWVLYRVLPEGKHVPTYEKLHVEYIAHNEEASWPTNGEDLPSWIGDAVVMFSYTETIPDAFADAQEIHGSEGSIGPLSTHGWTIERRNQAASVQTDFGGESDLVFTARTLGEDGNNITVEYDDPSEDTSIITVTVDETTINVALAGTEEGSTTKARNVKSAIEANAEARALIRVALAEGSNGTGLVTGNSWSLSDGGDVIVEPIAENSDFSGGRSIWFAWTAPEDMLVEFDTGGSYDSSGSLDALDTVIAVWTGKKVNALTEIVSNDGSDSSPHGDFIPDSFVTFVAAKSTRYLIQVGPYSDEDVLVRLNWRKGNSLTQLMITDGETTVKNVRKITLNGMTADDEGNGEVEISGVSAVTSLSEPASFQTNIQAPTKATYTWRDQLVFTAVESGTSGNSLRLAVNETSPGPNDAANHCRIGATHSPPDYGKDLKISRESDGMGGFTTTLQNVIDAITTGVTADEIDVRLFFTVALAEGASGSDLIDQGAQDAVYINLAGGLADCGDNDLIYTSKEIDSSITVEYIEPTEDSEDTVASASGDDIIVELAGTAGMKASLTWSGIVFTVTRNGAAANNPTGDYSLSGYRIAPNGGSSSGQALIFTSTEGIKIYSSTLGYPTTAIVIEPSIGATLQQVIDAVLDAPGVSARITAELDEGSSSGDSYVGGSNVWRGFSGGTDIVISATADDVKAAVNGDPDCHALVLVEDAPDNDGSGVVTTMSATPLIPPTLTGEIAFVSETLQITVEGNTIRIEVPS